MSQRRVAALVTGLVATAAGLVGAGRPTIWYDEAVTLSLLDRPLRDIPAVLREVDAVHGLYYLALRTWTLAAGDSIEAVRAFSALGVGVTAAATVLLVARHQSTAVAATAGLFTGITPGLAWTAVDGRSYAWSAAFAVLATLALDGACRDRRRRDWAWYGAVCLVACWWHLYVVLLVVAHGIGVLVGCPGVRRAWMSTAALLAAGLVPIGVLAWQQRDQVAWLADVPYTWDEMLTSQLASWQAAVPHGLRVAIVAGLLALSAVGVGHLWRLGPRGLPSVLTAWAGLPTVLALICAAFDSGMHPRYVTFAVPAFVIAATIGASALPSWSTAVVGVAAVVAFAPVVVAQRAPAAKPDDLRRIAATAAAVPADAVYFTVPKARSVASAYPAAFAGKEDVSAPPDPTPDPFFPGIRDPATLKGVDVAGLDVLVYGTRPDRSADRLRELGCRSRPVTADRHYVVALYTCPEITRAGR